MVASTVAAAATNCYNSSILSRNRRLVTAMSSQRAKRGCRRGSSRRGIHSECLRVEQVDSNSYYELLPAFA
jgi:hypothetical protein